MCLAPGSPEFRPGIYAIFRVFCSVEHPIRTLQQLGQVVEGVRKQRGWTQSELGSRVGLRQAAISGIETDPSSTKLSRIHQLLSALDLELVVRPRSSSPSEEW